MDLDSSPKLEIAIDRDAQENVNNFVYIAA